MVRTEWRLEHRGEPLHRPPWSDDEFCERCERVTYQCDCRTEDGEYPVLVVDAEPCDRPDCDNGMRHTARVLFRYGGPDSHTPIDVPCSSCHGLGAVPVNGSIEEVWTECEQHPYTSSSMRHNGEPAGLALVIPLGGNDE